MRENHQIEVSLGYIEREILPKKRIATNNSNNKLIGRRLWQKLKKIVVGFVVFNKT